MGVSNASFGWSIQGWITNLSNFYHNPSWILESISQPPLLTTQTLKTSRDRLLVKGSRDHLGGRPPGAGPYVGAVLRTAFGATAVPAAQAAAKHPESFRSRYPLQ